MPVRLSGRYVILLIVFLIAAGICSTAPIFAEENIPAGNTLPAVPSGTLYQVAFKAARPVTGMAIAEYSTGEVLASWSFSNSASSSGTYYNNDTAGRKFLLSIKDSGDNGQFISVTSRFANLLRMKVTYADGIGQEIVPDFPIVLFNCSFEDMTACAPGGSLSSPYQDCSRAFAGYVELVVTHSNGTWKEFEQNVLQPLKISPEWNAADICTFVFRKLDRGFYAEVRITTPTCLQTVSQKLQGNPDVLSAKGRQIIVNYKTAAQPPVPPAPIIQD
jgi:hypothetical protein